MSFQFSQEIQTKLFETEVLVESMRGGNVSIVETTKTL